ELVRSGDAGLVDGDAQVHHVAALDQDGDRAFAVQVLVHHEHAERLTDRGGMPAQLAGKPEVGETPHPSGEQAEMSAARLLRRFLEQPAEGGIRDAVLGVLQRVRRESGTLEYIGGLAAELANQGWQRNELTDPLAPW